jgi:SAM-dependent methyltransferase
MAHGTSNVEGASVVYDDDIAAMYDNDSHGIYRASHDALLDMIPREATYASVLDVGAGTGTVLRRLQDTFHPTALFGLDPSAAMLEKAAAKVPEMTAILNDDRALIDDERLRDLDLVVANFVLAYSPPGQLLGRIHATLKPGGIAAISTSTLNSFQEIYRLTSHPIFRVFSLFYDISPETVASHLPPLPKNADDLCRMVTDGGFEVLEVRTRHHTMTFKNGRALYDFGREGGWWLDLIQRLGVTTKSLPWVHASLRACQLFGLIDKNCTTTMETCTAVVRKRT